MSQALGRWSSRLSSPLPRKGRPVRAASRTLRPWRPGLEGLESRTVLSVTIANGNGYAGLDFNQSGGYTPPDTCGAAGPTSYVETVNQTVALYGSKATGSPATTSSLSNFWFTTGKLARADSGSGLSDPIVAYNDQIGRFIVGDQDVDFNTHVSTFDIAVSKTSSPADLTAASWTFYRISTTESGYDADYPGNFGYNHDAFVFTLNMFGAANHAMVVSVSNADLAANVPQSSLHLAQNDINDGSLRPTVMHDSVAGDPMWLVTEHGDNQSIDVIKLTVLSSTPGFTYTNLAVTPYSGAVHPLNPNGTAVTTNMDSRIQKAAEWNHVLVASHSVSASATEDDAQWYAIDVSSGTPTLKDQGRVSAGNNTYVTFPSVDINASGQIGMTYMKSGNDTSTDFLSMYVTGRNSGDPAGTMEASVLVPAGTGQANYKDFSNGGRAGDLSGINVDPTDGSFWAANEFANTEATANWGTAVANFTIGNPLPATDMAVTATGTSSVDVTSGPATASYTITITNNGPNAAQGAVLTDTLPAGSTYVSTTPATGNRDAFTFAQSGGLVTETASASIGPGSSDTFTVVVTVPASQANGSTITDAASVSASNPDPNTANNTATANTTVTNTNTSADLAVAVSGPSTANEGDTVTYTIKVTNAGPNAASGVTLTDTLPAVLAFKSATPSGTFGVSNGVVTFTVGTVAAGGTFTATVTAQAIEDGSASDSASVASSSPDPNTANNSATTVTSFGELAPVVSAPFSTRSRTLTNYQVATFTHASGIEPTSAFNATINWGDGTTSAGSISQSGTTYKVTGSHTYAGGSRHTVSTTVTETGNSVDKFGDNPGAASPLDRDVVRLSDVSDDDDSGDTGGDGMVVARQAPRTTGTPSTVPLGGNPGLAALDLYLTSLGDPDETSPFLGLGQAARKKSGAAQGPSTVSHLA
jgi:uncharacterized repeat protein (TIGR01451 family)